MIDEEGELDNESDAEDNEVDEVRSVRDLSPASSTGADRGSVTSSASEDTDSPMMIDG